MRPPRSLGLLVPGLIFLLVGAVFLPALRGEFLNWDDSVNFVANPHYRGLAWPQIKWMLGATLMGHYIPVTWFSFGLNYTLGGMNPWGYHLGNLLVHATNATLVYLIARRLLAAAHGDGAQRGHTAGPIVAAGAFAAVVWGVHPLRVESVAWITERRDVLCGLFFLLTILAYLKSLERGGHPRPIWQVVALVAFAAALLSKAAAMPLPAVLLLLDVYPLQRRGAGWKRLVIEKVPYAVLAGATAVVALIALPRGAAVTSYESYGMGARIGMVAYSFIFYPSKLILPVSLSPMYELPARVELDSWPFLAALLGVVGVTAILFLARTRWPGGLAAWTYSALMVLPVSGFVHAGSQLVNDRYSYLSSLGFTVLAGAGLLAVLRLRERGRATRTTVSVLDGGRGARSSWPWAWRPGRRPTSGGIRRRSGGGRWRWTRPARSVTATWAPPSPRRRWGRPASTRRKGTCVGRSSYGPTTPIPHFNLGTLLSVRARYAEAEAALRTLPRAPAGGAGRPGAARPALPAPGPPRGCGPARSYAPGACRQQDPRGPGGPASTTLATAISLVEDDPGTLMLLGRALVEQGKPGDAIFALRRAAALDPSAVPARFWLVLAYRGAGRDDLAREQLEVLRRLDPRAAAGLPVR